MRSIEDSLKRLGVDHLDIVWIHDLARDFHGDDWTRVFEVAHRGAMVALTKLREQKVIKAWGLGVNRVEPCELVVDMTETHPDGFLLAGRYTLLDHELALQRLMPACEGRKDPEPLQEVRDSDQSCGPSFLTRSPGKRRRHSGCEQARTYLRGSDSNEHSRP